MRACFRLLLLTIFIWLVILVVKPEKYFSVSGFSVSMPVGFVLKRCLLPVAKLDSITLSLVVLILMQLQTDFFGGGCVI